MKHYLNMLFIIVVNKNNSRKNNHYLQIRKKKHLCTVFLDQVTEINTNLLFLTKFFIAQVFFIKFFYKFTIILITVSQHSKLSSKSLKFFYLREVKILFKTTPGTLLKLSLAICILQLTMLPSSCMF